MERLEEEWRDSEALHLEYLLHHPCSRVLRHQVHQPDVRPLLPLQPPPHLLPQPLPHPPKGLHIPHTEVDLAQLGALARVLASLQTDIITVDASSPAGGCS